MMEFLDANVILRFLTKDDPAKANRCFELFARVKAKEIVLTTSESVLAEVVYVLSSKSQYDQPRENIRRMMLPLVGLPGLKILHRRALLRALDIFSTSRLDFEDALSIAHMERLKVKTIVSYDKDFDGIEGLRRREP
jgi:predicted nucleic acid-binding protein